MPEWAVVLVSLYCVGIWVSFMIYFADTDSDNPFIEKHGMYRGYTILVLRIFAFSIGWLPFVVYTYINGMVKGK